MIFVCSLQRPRAGFSQRHGFSMHCRVISQLMRQAKRASFFFRQSSKRCATLAEDMTSLLSD
jgi:hypothetical protein